jgi:hypothetical protein
VYQLPQQRLPWGFEGEGIDTQFVVPGKTIGQHSQPGSKSQVVTPCFALWKPLHCSQHATGRGSCSLRGALMEGGLEDISWPCKGYHGMLRVQAAL